MTMNVSMLAVDSSKGSFQVCAVGLDGTVPYNLTLSQSRFSALLADQLTRIVATEACVTSHLRHDRSLRIVAPFAPTARTPEHVEPPNRPRVNLAHDIDMAPGLLLCICVE